MTALPPGSTVGILGGGQLGRMLALAAARLGLKCHIYAPKRIVRLSTSPPASSLPPTTTKRSRELRASVDVVTYEFENIPVATVEFCRSACPCGPARRRSRCAQDRIKEKTLSSRSSAR